MSRHTPNSSYLPDPRGWIETAPPSSSRSKPRRNTQRPLLSFSHGLVTPVNSGYKRSAVAPTNRAGSSSTSRFAIGSGTGTGIGPSSLSRRRRSFGENDIETPSNAAKAAGSGSRMAGALRGNQRTLSQFLSPPTTGPTSLMKGKGKGKERAYEFEGLRTPFSTKDSPTPSTGLAIRGGLTIGRKDKDKGKGRFEVHRDREGDFWGSSASSDKEEDLPAVDGRVDERKEKARSSGIERSIGRAGSKFLGREPSKVIDLSKDDDLARPSSSKAGSSSRLREPLDSPQRQLPPPPLSPGSRRKPRARNSGSSSPPLFAPAPVAASIADRREEGHTPSTVNAAVGTSPPPPITPVPEYVRLNHRQLCGQDSAQQDKNRQYWRRDRDRDTSPAPILSRASARQTEPGEISANFMSEANAVELEEQGISKKRKRAVSPRDQINRRVWEAAHEKKHATPQKNHSERKGMEKKLVDLSSSDPLEGEGAEEGDLSEPKPKSKTKAKTEQKGEEKKLVELTSSDPIDDDLPATPSKRVKRAITKRESRGPLTPLKTNAVGLGKTVSSSMIGRQISPTSNKRAHQRISKTVSPRVARTSKVVPLSSMPRTFARQASPSRTSERLERLHTPSPARNGQERSAEQRAHVPMATEAELDIEQKIDDVIAEARENEARLERSLKDLGKAASQASQQRQKHSQSDKHISPSRSSLPDPHHDLTSSPHVLLTPRKAKPNKASTSTTAGTKMIHHHVTPPKSRTRFKPMTERQETLFILPDPPAKPDFRLPSSSLAKEDRKSDWEPAEMEPETLMTWGLDEPELEPEFQPEYDLDVGPEVEVELGPEPERPRAAFPEDQNAEPSDPGSRMYGHDLGQSQCQSPEPPLFSDPPSPISSPVRPGLDQHWSSKSIEPTMFSQDFPVLVPTSPGSEREVDPQPVTVRRRPAARQRQVAQGPVLEDDPGHTPRTTTTATPAPASGAKVSAGAGKAKWDHLSRGILAPTPSAARKYDLPTSTNSRGSASTPTRQTNPFLIKYADSPTNAPTTSPRERKRKAPSPSARSSVSRPERTRCRARTSTGTVTRSQAGKEGEQTQLAAFGFFGDGFGRKRRRIGTDPKAPAQSQAFEGQWEDEEEFDFDVEEEHRELRAGDGHRTIGAEVKRGANDAIGGGSEEEREQEQGRSKKLGKVPEAPYHPSLRPASIRELERRAALTSGHQESTSSRDRTRSLQEGDVRDDVHTPTRSSRNKTTREEVDEEEDRPLFERRQSSPNHDTGTGSHSYTSSSQSHGDGDSEHSRSSRTPRTPGSTRDWWAGLDGRRGSEFGTME